MTKESTKRLTEGRPMRLILGFALPTLAGMLFQQFYSLVDTIIVGHTLGVRALAAVGSTGSIIFLIIGFCMGVCSGFSIPIAQRFGAKDDRSMRRYVTNSIWLCVILAAVMTVIVSIFCRQILTAMRTPADILDAAYNYLIIIFLGIPITYLYNLTSGIMRSLGDSSTPVIFLILASLVNIFLDLIFIIRLHTGVEGAALATVISQAISGILCVVFMIRRFPVLKMQSGDWHLNSHHARNLLVMGVPMGLQYSITAIGSVILQSAVNSLGSAAVASVTAATKLYGFLGTPFDALGATMATYGGQNTGAGFLGRLKEGLRAASLLGAVYSVIALVVIFFLGQPLLLLFLDASEKAILTDAYQFLMIQLVFFIPLTFVNVIRFLIQGMGFSGRAVIAGVMEMIARTAVALTMVAPFGLTGAAFASPAAWLLADAYLFPTFSHCYHILEKRLSRS